MKHSLLKWGAIAFALFHVYNNLFAGLADLWFAAIHFGGFAVLCALGFHHGPQTPPTQPLYRHPAASVFDTLLALSAVVTTAYLLLFESALYAREGDFIWSDYLMATLSVVLAIELTRRTTGWFMPTLIVVSLCYMVFLGKYIPGVFEFPGLSIETTLYRSYFSSEGMFGQVADISASYVFMFILFGSFLLHSGAGDFIVKLAQCLAGRYTGGAGVVAVTGSALMGSVSGSAVANAVSVGVITIPMMNKSGFKPQFSAGVVAAASTGGPLMPPIMGAGAFVISSYTDISYLQIIAVSTLPAILYFLTVSYFVRIEAKRLGLRPTYEGPPVSVRSVVRDGWPFIVPLVALVGLLVYGLTPITAAVLATLCVIATSRLSATPMDLDKCITAILDAVRTMIPTALLLVAVGLVINVVNTTGIGNSLSLMIIEWAQGNLLIALLLIALASLVLGMGLPVTASYIVLATLTAPTLFDLISQERLLTALRANDLPSHIQAILNLFGGDPLTAVRDMPLEMKQLLRSELLDPALLSSMLLSAHLIIFWLSQDSNVTPPVCLAAFAAAGVAGTRPMATGLTAWKLSKGLYLVPLMFAYSPLITGSWPERFAEFFWACLGLYAWAGVLHWHLESRLTMFTAALLATSGSLLMWAPFSVYHHVGGALLLIAVVFWQRRTPAM